MKNPDTKSLNPVSRTAALVGLVACSLTLPSGIHAIQDPPGCGLAEGGKGNSYQSGLNFRLTQAHVGDSVPVYPVFGMDHGACRAIHVTGSVYIATGKLITFLNDATLDPGILARAPYPPCKPGPYDILITPALVGAGVSSPHGSIAGVPKTVRAMENVDATVLTGASPEQLSGGFHSATIAILTPEIRVVHQPAYPPGQTGFQEGQNVQFTGYVTNSGDIALTNLTVMDSRAGLLQLFNPANGLPYPANVILPPGAHAAFSNSFVPTVEEMTAGSATSAITVTARDTTEIGGPNALVTHSTTTACAISGIAIPAQPLPATLTAVESTADRQFRFTVTGQLGANYVIQATTNLNSTNWLSLATNTAPFTFVDSNAALYPMRFYRAIARP